MNRRKFLTAGGAGIAASALGGPFVFSNSPAASAFVSAPDTPPIRGDNEFYRGNRAPLTPSPLMKLPIGAIEPRGWIREQLVLMSHGMTGHLPEFSKYLQPDSAWLTGKSTDYGWEEVPYWLRGFADLGYILGDPRINRESRRWLDAALTSQQLDGYFGPPVNKAKDDLWPNMPMLNAFQSLYEATGDPRVIPMMTNYFGYQQRLPRARLLPGSWQKVRGGDNLASVYWLYNRTGDAWLLELATALHEQTADWTAGPQTHHGVNTAEGFREPATYWQQARDPKFLDATERDYRLAMDEYGRVPGGMFGADENYRPGHTGPSQAAETCSMVEFMHSFEMLLAITGDAMYADRCENVAFNSLPAAQTADLKALHYLTAPNLSQCDTSGVHVFDNRGEMLPFSPRVVYRCCQHNVSMGWPYYAEHLWMAAPDNGLAAIFYAPSAVEARVGHGAKVRIEEETDYPFGESVELRVAATEPVRFPLLLRVPGWAAGAEAALNGRRLETAEMRPGRYLAIERVWRDDDRVGLHFPMRIELTEWRTQGDAISVSRGPLTYSLKIGERWQKIGGTDAWPDSAVYPTTPWNVGLFARERNPASSFTVTRKSRLAAQPFDLDSAPVEIHAQGKVIPQWTLAENCAGPPPHSPASSNEPPRDMVLAPMGCARLRISVLPSLAG